MNDGDDGGGRYVSADDDGGGGGGCGCVRRVGGRCGGDGGAYGGVAVAFGWPL